MRYGTTLVLDVEQTCMMKAYRLDKLNSSIHNKTIRGYIPSESVVYPTAKWTTKSSADAIYTCSFDQWPANKVERSVRDLHIGNSLI